MQFVVENNIGAINSADIPYYPVSQGRYFLSKQIGQQLTEIREGEIYLCLEQRLVTVCGQVIELTVKEFEILSLLIMNPKRVFTYELIMDLVWKEDYTYYSRKAINNHVSNLRKKLKIDPGDPAISKVLPESDINLHCHKFTP